ncbi:MAG: BLUF domain-containing protein [Bacteroidota bacterium]
MTDTLRQIAYTSSTVGRLSRSDVLDILHVSRRNNQEVGVTGVLLYSDGAFLQVLEGESDAVETVYKRVRTDSRHHHVISLFDLGVQERSFADWSMGLLRVGDLVEDGPLALTSLLNRAEAERGRVWSMLRAFRYIARARRPQPAL